MPTPPRVAWCIVLLRMQEEHHAHATLIMTRFRWPQDAPAGGNGDGPQCGPAKTAVMSPNSIRLKSGETPSLLTTMEG